MARQGLGYRDLVVWWGKGYRGTLKLGHVVHRTRARGRLETWLCDGARVRGKLGLEIG